MIVALNDLAARGKLGIIRSPASTIDEVARRPRLLGHDSSVSRRGRTRTRTPGGKRGKSA